MQGRNSQPKTVQRPGSVGAVAFSPDGKLLAIGGAVPAKNGYARGEILVWDVASSQQRHVLAGHPGAVGALAFTPDGKILASGGQRQYALHLGEEPQNVKLWDVASGRELATMLGQGDQVTCIAFFPMEERSPPAASTARSNCGWPIATGRCGRRSSRPPGRRRMSLS